MSMKRFRAAVIGCGSIGKRHLSNMREIGIGRIIACDVREENLKFVKASYGVDAAYRDYRKALHEEGRIDAAFICTPNNLHIAPATFFARNGVNLFIEKPLSDSMTGVRELLKIARKKKLVTMMGMCYRFHPGLRIIKDLLVKEALGAVYSARAYGGHYLPDWLPGADYRHLPYSRKASGGGVILTSIHGFDYVRWLFGEVREVFGYAGKASSLEIDVEDMVAVLCRTGRGVVVSIYSDFLERHREQKIDIVCERGTIHWDYDRNEVKAFKVPAREWRVLRYRFRVNDMYVQEMKHFFRCLEAKRTDRALDINDGMKTLEFALGAKQSGKTGKIVHL